jgi:tetratricopeptide (TPR) repeat protein
MPLSQRALRLADGILLGLLLVVAFALGCQELFDSDIWWHIRSGQWIWEHGKPPALDPFTFASSERPWIDLHWLFQLIVAAAYTIAGVRGVILLTACMCAVVVGIAVAAAPSRLPGWLTVSCWLPAVVAMSARFDPRPELFSLLWIAVFLHVLTRAERRPALLWLLPLVQVAWVNTHALFVLGPVITGAFLLDRLAHPLGWTAPRSALEQSETDRSRPTVAGRPFWTHAAGATAGLAVACLVNPYGMRGALFPLELFPKITAWGGPYKTYVAEFMDIPSYVKKVSPLVAASNLYFRAQCFLLGALPLGFILPSVWRSARAAAATTGPAIAPSAGASVSTRAAFVWFGCILSSALGLIVLWVLALPGALSPGRQGQLGLLAPIGMLLLATAGAAALLYPPRRPSLPSAVLTALGGIIEAGWLLGMQAGFFGTASLPAPCRWWVEGGPRTALGITLGAVICGSVLYLAVRAGARLFHLVLAATFGLLAVLAIRNINLFGLVAGFVLTCSLGAWLAEAAGQLAARSSNSALAARFVVRGLLIGLVSLLLAAIISDRFFRLTGEARRFGLRETPLAYAHEAARFAGRSGLPERALAFDLRQAGVYLFHNGPRRKLFMDGRLEVPTRATFETYVRLDHLLSSGRRGWAELLRRMDDPLVLLDHEENFGAEATLMADPNWSCLYYDDVASIFVSTRHVAHSSWFPPVDFLSRHFRPLEWPAPPLVPTGLAEARGLFYLGLALRKRPGLALPWKQPASLLLLACDRFRAGLDQDPRAPGAVGLWSALGNSCWSLLPDLSVPPLGPHQAWDPALGLLPAQATFCYRSALALEPENVGMLAALLESFQSRRMRDAHETVINTLRKIRPDRDRASVEFSARALTHALEPDRLAEMLDHLLEQGRTEAAVATYQNAEKTGAALPWTSADAVALALLHLGHPHEARRLWEHAPRPPTEGMRLCRLGTAALAALDFTTAERDCRAALEVEPGLGEAWFGLAMLYTQRGNAQEAYSAARSGLATSLSPPQRRFLAALQSLAAPYVTDAPASASRQDLPDHMSVDVGQPAASSVMAVREPLVVQT